MIEQRRLWEYRWVRDLLTLLTAGVVLSLMYQARSVIAPVLIGLGAAYVVNPVIKAAHRRWRIPRWLSGAAVMVLGLLVLSGLLLYLVPKLVHQVSMLAKNLPPYVEYLGQRLGIDWSNLAHQAGQAFTPTTQPGQAAGTIERLSAELDAPALVDFLVGLLGTGIGIVGTAVGSTAYLSLVAVVIGYCYLCFSADFDGMATWFGGFIPTARRDRVIGIVGRMDKAVAGFVRGRLIQSLVMAAILTVGWGLVGVPYWVLLGIAAGVVSLVPYAASVVWLVAIGLTWVDTLTGQTGFSMMHVMIWPSVVYFVAQGLDGWVIEPMVQSRATNLNPLSVMLAVLIGGTLAGLIGLILAVPVTACIKILAQELVLPRLRPEPSG